MKMNPQNKKDACLLYRTIVEAAKEMEKDEALELLLAYADYALGDTDEIITDNKYIKLILKQVVPSLKAADNRYRAAVDNGNKGKESGKNGGGIGRPRNNETPEEYQKRVEEWKRSKNPQNNPQNSFDNVSCFNNPVITPNNPEKTLDNNPVFEKTPSQAIENPQKNPLDVDVDVEVDVEEEKDVDVEEEKDIDVYVDNDKDINLEEDKDIYVENKDTEYYLKSFLNNPTKDYSCLLNNITFFLQRNNSDLTDLQENLKKKCNCDMTFQEIVEVLQFMYKEKINFKTA